MKLSEHFTKEEFIYSETATKLGISNEPTETILNVMIHTCTYLLEPLRALLNEHYGCTVTVNITSGYRSTQLNKAVGGVSTSEHCKGQAVDIYAVKVKDGVKTTIGYKELYNLIIGWVKEGKLSVNQCIQEQSGSSTWVHVSMHSWGKTLNKNEFLVYKNGVYTSDN